MWRASEGMEAGLDATTFAAICHVTSWWPLATPPKPRVEVAEAPVHHPPRAPWRQNGHTMPWRRVALPWVRAVVLFVS